MDQRTAVADADADERQRMDDCRLIITCTRNYFLSVIKKQMIALPPRSGCAIGGFYAKRYNGADKSADLLTELRSCGGSTFGGILTRPERPTTVYVAH